MPSAGLSFDAHHIAGVELSEKACSIDAAVALIFEFSALDVVSQSQKGDLDIWVATINGSLHNIIVGIVTVQLGGKQLPAVQVGLYFHKITGGLSVRITAPVT